MNRHAALRFSTVAALWVAQVAIAYAATPATLVRDLRHNPGPNLSSSPRSMISLGNRALFWARTPQLGAELYRTDGTAAGTALLTDLCPGPCDSFGSVEPVVAGGRAYFLASDGARGVELWSSNGTGPGTRSFIDLAPGPADGVYLFLREGGDRVLFTTFHPSLRGWDLWSSDGSPAGSAPFVRISGEAGGGVSIPDGAGSPRPMPGGRRLYLRNFRIDGVEELWESDGTAAGTRRLLALRQDAGESICSVDADLPKVVAGDFYFSAATAATGCEVWRVAGGVAKAFADVAAGPAHSFPRSFVSQGEWTLFVADLPGAPNRLWTTDGTLARTLPAAPAGSPAGSLPVYLGSDSAGAYFAAETVEQGRELWVTSGPPGQFRALGDFVSGAGSSNPERAGVVGDRVYFWTSHPDRGIELNAASGSDVQSVARVRLRGDGDGFAAVGDQAVFGADLGLGLGIELAVTDGLPGGTSLLRDLGQGDPSSYPRQLTRVGGRLLFTAIDDAHGGEVWRSDGKTAGTELVADLTPGREPADFPLLLAPTASGVVLEAPDGSIRHAPARRGGIDLLFRPASEVRGSHRGFRLGAKALFFAPVGDAENPRFELWQADGRPEGSRRLAEISGFDRFFGYGMLSAVDPERRRAFFIPSTFDVQFGSVPLGLWITDGTGAGTRRVLAHPCDFCFGGIGEAIVGPGGRFFYTADDFSEDVSQLWATDGTTAGTVKLVESPHRIDGDPIRTLARLGELLLFAASDSEHGQELWVSDGTPGGTRLLADLRPGPAPSWPDGITVVGARAFFSADDGATGRELWATDGTAEGTYRVADIRQGARSSVPQNLTAIGNRLVFAAADDRHGLEVWSSDGTAAGTRLASDVQVGRLPSSPSDFIIIGSDLLFVAARLGTGRELFRLPLTALGAP